MDDKLPVQAADRKADSVGPALNPTRHSTENNGLNAAAPTSNDVEKPSTAHNVTPIDVVDWEEGEDDPAMPTNWYTVHYTTLLVTCSLTLLRDVPGRTCRSSKTNPSSATILF
jgi:hypothetical protein